MKKKLFLFFIGLVVCVGFLNAQTLDETILRAALRIGTDLPAGSTVAVINFRADPETLASYMINELHGTLLRNRSVTPVKPNEAQQQNIRDTLRFDAAGGIEGESARSIGRLLSVRYLITGSVQRGASGYEILVVTVDVESTELKSRYSATVNSNDATIASLLGTTPAVGSSSSSRSDRSSSSSRDTRSDSPPAPADLDTWRNKWIYLGGTSGVGIYFDSALGDEYNDEDFSSGALPVLGFLSEFSLLPFLSLEVDLDIGLGPPGFIFSPTLLAKFGYRFPRIELFFDVGYTMVSGGIFVLAPIIGGTFGVKVGPGILFAKYHGTLTPLSISGSSIGKISLGYKVGVVNKKKKPVPQTDTTQSDSSGD